MRFLTTILFWSLLAPISGNAQDGGDVFKKYETDVRKAVNRGLEFLISNENQDGSFPGGAGKSTGISGLVGMAFLSTGATPGNGPHGEMINRRIDYILKGGVDKNGVLSAYGAHGSGPMYAHNICTLFLSECSGMVDAERQKKIDPILARAVKILLEAQAVPKGENNKGGWRYHANSNDSDLSCSGWALMALRSARLNGAPVPKSAIQEAVDYTLRNQNKTHGHFGYTDTDSHKESLTGAGLLCLELCGRHGSKENTMAADWLLANHAKVNGGGHPLYANYYNAQAMFQIGGKHWKTYATWMYDTYLPKQRPNGVWDGEGQCEAYGTSIMVLAMTVPFRQLPIYQRDERVDEE